MSVDRKPRVYYLPEKEGRKAMLVFDAGYALGDIHIYEHRETIDTKKLEEEMKQFYGKDQLSEAILSELVALWIEKKLGYPMSWKLVP
jgi:hypothetical protein